MTKILSVWVCLLVSLMSIQAQQKFNPTPFHTIKGYKNVVTEVCLSANNKYLAISDQDNTVELRNKRFEKIWSYKNNPKSYGMRLCFAPNEKYLAFSRYQSARDVAILDIAQKQVIQRLKTGWRAAMDYSPKGEFLVTAGATRERTKGVIKVWQWKGKQFELLQSFPYQHKRFRQFRTVAFSPNGQYFALTGYTGAVIVYKKSKGKFKLYQQHPHKSYMISLAFHPSGKYLFFGNHYMLYSLRFGKKLTPTDSIAVREGPFSDIRFHNNKGNKIIVANKSIKVFDWADGKFEHDEEEDIFDLHGNNIFTIDINKGLVVSGGKNKNVIVSALGKIPVAQAKPSKRGANNTSKKANFDSDDLDFDVGASGKNYLLVVGINKYKSWKPLMNATTDARKVVKVLQKRYGFAPENTLEIYDEQATSKSILKKLSNLREKLTPQDNLLLYYSGHGYYNAAIKEGFWIPFNAQKGEETQYLANATLLKYIKAIKARHIFLVADACFSGSLFTQGKRGYIDNVEKYRSRWGFASGRLELVSDGTIGESSPFATYFLKFLTQNQKKRFAISELIQYVKVAVSNNASQTPIGHPLKNVGDEGGEFVFYLKK